MRAGDFEASLLLGELVQDGVAFSLTPADPAILHRYP